MAPPLRRGPAGLTDTDLFDSPGGYDLDSAVAEAARLDPLGRPAGRGRRPDDEPVRFRGWPSLTFPPAALMGATPARGGAPAELVVAQFGLFGNLGALPTYWTELLLHALDEGDTRLRDFLDVFNHRLILLYHQAGWFGPPGVEHAAWRRGDRPDPDAVTRLVRSVLGLDGPPDDVLVSYAALWLAAPSRTALEHLLTDYLGVPVGVLPFRGEWGPSAPGAAAAGTCDTACGFRLTVGPMGWARYRDFLPGGPGLPTLLRLTRLMVGPALSFDVELRLHADERPPARYGDGGRRGWSAWQPGGAGTGWVCGVLSRRTVERGERGEEV